MKSPLCFAVASSLLFPMALSLPAAQSGAPSVDREQMKKLRKKAAHRKRRVIFNNDGDDVVAFTDAPTAAAQDLIQVPMLSPSTSRQSVNTSGTKAGDTPGLLIECQRRLQEPTSEYVRRRQPAGIYVDLNTRVQQRRGAQLLIALISERHELGLGGIAAQLDVARLLLGYRRLPGQFPSAGLVVVSNTDTG